MTRVDPEEARTMRNALRRAIAVVEQKYGSRARAAAAMGVSRQLVQGWITWGRVSSGKTLLLEEHSGISRHDLRPDLYRHETTSAA
jgi:DNA-binding transcriptional regulator YdaS (Cro superfamily)